MVERGDVWLIRLDPTEAREIRKTRPCLIVSPPEIHASLPLAIIVPLTSGSQPAPYRVEVTFAGKKGLVLTEQIRSVDKRRLVRRLGTVNRSTLLAVLTILGEMFADGDAHGKAGSN